MERNSEMLPMAPGGAVEGELIGERLWPAIEVLREQGLSKKAVARELRLDIKTVRRWWARSWPRDAYVAVDANRYPVPLEWPGSKVEVHIQVKEIWISRPGYSVLVCKTEMPDEILAVPSEQDLLGQQVDAHLQADPAQRHCVVVGVDAAHLCEVQPLIEGAAMATVAADALDLGESRVYPAFLDGLGEGDGREDRVATGHSRHAGAQGDLAWAAARLRRAAAPAADLRRRAAHSPGDRSIRRSTGWSTRDGLPPSGENPPTTAAPSTTG